ncbi:MAG TPA: aspartate carbamoyltransferase regulatory subunit [Candidatus Brocadiia bacterium]|nr:aspartate carbamoyltransferase regulatory subunit [Candidatus Brocadiia bacterium]
MAAEKMRKREVSAIKDGTVIDHIDGKATFKVAALLKADSREHTVLVGANLSSRKIGRKGIIKIENTELTPDEVNRIALAAPDATLSIIKDYAVVMKRRIELPDVIEGIVKCFNPSCVSNHEKIQTRFIVVGRDPIRLRCYHCDRYETGDEIIL